MQARKASVLGRATARGLTAAMAMSGIRGFTANAGLLNATPPEAVVERHGPQRLQQLDPHHRAAVTELAHWVYGACGGLVFGLFPPGLRARRVSGPLYGVTVWLAFELGIGPMLGVQDRPGGPLARLMLVMDHALYGVMVGGQLAPEPEITWEARRSRRARRRQA